MGLTVTVTGSEGTASANATAGVSVGQPVIEVFDEDSGQLVATSGAVASIMARGTITANQPNGKFILMEPEEARRLRIVVRGTGADNDTLDVQAELLPGLGGGQLKTIRLAKNESPEGKISFRQDISVGAPPTQGSPIPPDRQFPLLRNAETFSSVDLTAAPDINDQDSRRFIARQKERGRIQLGDAVLHPEPKGEQKFSEQVELTEANGSAALQAGGYQTLRVGFEGKEAWVRVKNQAAKLYLSGHGWHDNNRFTDHFGTVFVSPTTDLNDAHGIVLQDWDNNLDTVIYAGCSLLDIGNFNNHRDFSRDSPGKEWAQLVRPETILLGYNDTAPLGEETAGAIDRRDARVVDLFYQRISAGDHPTLAWLQGNAQLENRIADHACAIFGDYYYFIAYETYSKGSNRRKIWKVHKDWWSNRHRFEDIPEGIGGRIRLRDLGNAVEGEGRNDAR